MRNFFLAVFGVFLLAMISAPKVLAVDVTAPATKTCSSYYNGTTYPCSKATDSDLGTPWVAQTYTGTTVNEWWKAYYASGQIVTEVIYNVESDRMRNFAFQGSDDNGTWVDLYTGENTNVQGDKDITFDNTYAYKYYRLLGIDAWGSNEQFAIYEINLFDTTPEPTPTVAPSPTGQPPYQPITTPNLVFNPKTTATQVGIFGWYALIMSLCFYLIVTSLHYGKRE